MRRQRLLWVLLTAVLPLGVFAFGLSSLLHARFSPAVAILAGVAAVTLLAALVSRLLSQRIARSVDALLQVAARHSRGDLSRRPPSLDVLEFDEVADAMTLTAELLADRIDALARATGEQTRVLASMVEGVLVVDADGNVLTLNQAAADLLGASTGPKIVGRSIEEVVRNPDVREFVADTLRMQGPHEGEITVHGGATRYLQAHGAPIENARGLRSGAVVVFNDVTRLQRLETVRKDFVANVSHELRTPVTSIKASVETLLEGAMDDAQASHRFLDIIARQSDRLAAIIEDLLSLSRIEQEADGDGIPLAEDDVRDVLYAAIDACRVTADAKGIKVNLDCATGLRARLNAALLEQALVNLIDNAVKYSNDASEIEVSAAGTDAGVRIDVRDRGPGIDAMHLDRLFERFYRVDRARSRRLGGTGLGLAIVKHVVQAHGGSVSVQSRLGRGSTFTIELPRV